MGVVRVQDGQRGSLGPGGPKDQADQQKGRDKKDRSCPLDHAQGELQGVTSEGRLWACQGKPLTLSRPAEVGCAALVDDLSSDDGQLRLDVLYQVRQYAVEIPVPHDQVSQLAP